MSVNVDDRKIPLTIDPGHKGSYNRGAAYEIQMGARKWYYEGTKMFEKAKYLKEYLDAYGIFKPIITRANVSDCPSLEKRAKIALDSESRAIISLHTNGANGTVAGTEILASVKRKEYKSTCDGLTKALVKTLKDCGDTAAKARSTVFKAQKNGDDYYGILRHAVASPGIEHVYLIEAGFHDHPIECEALVKAETLKALAKTEAEYLYNLMKDLYLDPSIPTYTTTITNATAVNVRVAPNTDCLVLGSITAKDKVEYIDIENDDWVKVLYKHCICYMSRKYVVIPDIPEVPTTVPGTINLADVTVNASIGLNVRSEPDASSNRLSTLLNKAKVTIDVTHSTDDWYAIYPYPVSGYISKKYTTEPTNQRTVEYAETNPDIVKPEETLYVGVVTAQAGLNLRTQPNINATRIETLKYKAEVSVHFVTDGWAYVSNADHTGYASANYLSISAVEPEEVEPVYDIRTVTCSVLNVRNGPGTTYDKIGSLKKDAVVNVTSISGDWCKITCNAYPVGYVHSKYLKVSSIFKSPELSAAQKTALNTMIKDMNVTASKWFTTLLNARISSGYGYRIHPITGAKQSFHQGIDYAALAGTPIVSPVNGVVSSAYYNSSYGNLLIIMSVTDQSRHYFAHQKVLPLPKVGDVVRRGDIIGYVGTTGSSTGNHLHYEIRLSTNNYKLYTDNINPDTYKYSN